MSLILISHAAKNVLLFIVFGLIGIGLAFVGLFAAIRESLQILAFFALIIAINLLIDLFNTGPLLRIVFLIVLAIITCVYILLLRREERLLENELYFETNPKFQVHVLPRFQQNGSQTSDSAYTKKITKKHKIHKERMKAMERSDLYPIFHIALAPTPDVVPSSDKHFTGSLDNFRYLEPKFDDTFKADTERKVRSVSPYLERIKERRKVKSVTFSEPSICIRNEAARDSDDDRSDANSSANSHNTDEARRNVNNNYIVDSVVNVIEQGSRASKWLNLNRKKKKKHVIRSVEGKTGDDGNANGAVRASPKAPTATFDNMGFNNDIDDLEPPDEVEELQLNVTKISNGKAHTNV